MKRKQKLIRDVRIIISVLALTIFINVSEASCKIVEVKNTIVKSMYYSTDPGEKPPVWP